jgi:hypothetical protein
LYENLNHRRKRNGCTGGDKILSINRR